nr:MAG TPA: hypothetical protein [Caudoviricetes sp.]
MFGFLIDGRDTRVEYPAAHLSWSGSRFGRPEWLSYKKDYVYA